LTLAGLRNLEVTGKESGYLEIPVSHNWEDEEKQEDEYKMKEEEENTQEEEDEE
jgi:hypothetical protein